MNVKPKSNEQTKETLSDENLVKKITESNNTYLFGLLYDRYVTKVYNKCLSFAASKDEAQDLTHDVFVKLFVKLKSFKGNSKFSTWIYAFTYNHCVNYVQREQSKRKQMHSIDEEISSDIEQEVTDEQIHELKSEKLVKALEKIKPDQKAILLMKYQDDFSIKEISTIFEIGESAVKMRLNRAKLALVNTYNKL